MPASLNRWLLLLLLLATTASLNGCSNRLGYNMLDWWARWQVRQHVSLDREQRHLVRDRINEAHDWHRETQLPRYVNFLEQTLASLEDTPVSEDTMAGHFHRALGLYRDLLDYLVAPAAEVLATFSDEQVAQLLASVRETQAETLKKGAERDEQEQYEAYRKRLNRQMERWAVEPTQEQAQWIEQWAQNLHPLQDEMAAMQELWLEALAQALSKRHDRQALEAALRTVMLEPQSLYPDDYRTLRQDNQQATLALITRINNHLTETQRTHRREKFRELIDDFERLAE